MNNHEESFAKFLFGIMALEVFLSLSLTFYTLSLITRVIICLLAILGVVIYHHLFHKLNWLSIMWMVGQCGYIFAIAILYKEAGLNIGNTLILVCSSGSASIVGYIISFRERFKQYPFYVLYGALFFFGIINVFYTLFQYGFFYVMTRSGTVTHMAKMLIGLNFYTVDTSFFGYAMSLLASGLNVLWLYKEKEKTKLYHMALACGVLGILGLILLPYWQGLFTVFVACAVIALIRFYPQDKKKRLIYWLSLGFILVCGVAFIIIKGQNIKRLGFAVEILKGLFTYPFGRQLEMSSKNIFLDAIYQGGIIPFVFLVVLFSLLIYQLYKYYHDGHDNKFVKECLLSFIVCYFVYVNLNYDQFVFKDNNSIIPCFLDPTLLLVMILYGYMHGKTYHQIQEKDVVAE